MVSHIVGSSTGCNGVVPADKCSNLHNSVGYDGGQVGEHAAIQIFDVVRQPKPHLDVGTVRRPSSPTSSSSGKRNCRGSRESQNWPRRSATPPPDGRFSGASSSTVVSKSTRKNALFAGSHGGGRTWATIATLLQTAKMNDSMNSCLGTTRPKRHRLGAYA
jgi:hypothetical protein